MKILIIQNVKVFSLTLAGKANFYIISFLLQTSACIYSIGVLTWDSQIEMLLHWQLCVAITHWSIRMHQLVNVALLCNLCLLWKYLQAIVSWFWKTWSFHVVRQILSLHYFMWKDSSRQSIFCPFILCPSTQRLTFLCFIKILTRCAFMLCWHLISLLLFSVLFSGWLPQTSSAQRTNNAEYFFFKYSRTIYSSECTISLFVSSLQPCFNRFRFDHKEVGNHRKVEMLLPPSTQFPSVTAWAPAC